MKRIFKNVRALSFDLDDTLYDNKPVIKNAFLALYNYLLIQCPNIALNYDFLNFMESAKSIKSDPLIILDIDSLRRLHIKQILSDSGYQDKSDELTEKAFNVFWQARQQVTLYPEVHQILQDLSAKLPLVTISNGNACIKSIGIDQYFHYSINAADTGKPKPDKSMFLYACEKLQIEAEQLVHIGDSVNYDINGAYQAGCRSIWLNQHSEKIQNHPADAVIEQLSELLTMEFQH